MDAKRIFLVSLFLCFAVFVFFSPVFAKDNVASDNGETLTITTYYPSPYGSYNQLSTNKLQFGLLNEAPDTCSSKIEGMAFYGTIDGVNNLYVCGFDGTSYGWWPMIAFPGVTWSGGYNKTVASEYSGFAGVWSKIHNWATFGAAVALSDYGFKINLKGQPSGEYEFTWTADIDVDQYSSFINTPGYATLGVVYNLGQNLNIYYFLDTSEPLADETFDGSVNQIKDSDWSNTAAFTNHTISRKFSKYWSRHSNDFWMSFAVYVKTSKGSNNMRVRIRNAKLEFRHPPE